MAGVFRANQGDTATATPGATPRSTPTSTPITGWEYAYYTYDSSHPHAVATIERGAGPDNFGYDAIGAMTTREDGSDTWTQGFDEEGRLETLGDGTDDWAFTYDGDGVPFIWDDNGNLIQDDTRIYGYDHANRLTLVLMDGDTYNFAYRCNGKSIGRFGCESDRVSQTVNSVTTNYVLDQAAKHTQVLSDGTNTYLYGIDRVGEEQPGGWQYHLGDALGSVRQLVDASDTVTLAQSYEPYGSILNSAGVNSTFFQFTGEQLDGTGLAYVRARYYAPYLNQWIQPDTIIPDFRNPQSINSYSYVNNNPINFTDPSGLTPCEFSGAKYCQVIGGVYDRAIIDLTHFLDSRSISLELRTDLDGLEGVDPGFLKMETSQLKIFKFSRMYRTRLPVGLTGPVKNQISLGIFMDFQWNLEATQSALVPWSETGFANEDLPSDYLGFIAGVKFPGSSLVDIGSRLMAKEIIPVTNKGIYEGNWLDAVNCHIRGECGVDNPLNCDFVFKLWKDDINGFEHVPWPSSLQMTPIHAGIYWEPITFPFVSSLD